MSSLRLFDYSFPMAKDNRPFLIVAYPARAVPLLGVTLLTIVFAVAFGGVLAQVLGGGFGSFTSFFYIALLALSFLGLHRSFRRIVKALKPALELNDEEIVDFRSDTRIPWETIIEFEQRRDGRRTFMRFRYLDEEAPEVEHVADVVVSGLSVSSVRLANQIRERFARVDAEDLDGESVSADVGEA
ncbi:hypothetical protein ASE36_09310 [Rhizobium sp. Root274]|nr:hypothetical protein ASE36_09310 [Rhizobium sp. Root274]